MNASALRAALAPLVLLAVVHAVVDTFALFLQPLWPDLKTGLSLGDGAIQGTFFVWNLATSIPQMAFGYWGDRYRLDWLLWAGPAVAMVCLSCIGLVESFFALNVLLVIGGLGIAAFHPEAAALAGSLFSTNRSRAMSIFAVGGYLGQALGPLYSGKISTWFSMSSLVWSIAWGWAGLLLLRPLLRRAPHAAAHALARPISLAQLVRGRELAVALLLVIGVLRVVPALGIPQALAFEIKARGGLNDEIGLVQMMFFVGIGLGGLGCATLVHRANERLALWLLPLLATPGLFACGATDGAGRLISALLGGLFLGGSLPVLVSYGQQLMPEGQRVASSITMGVTWGLGSGVVAAIMTLVNHFEQPELAVYWFTLGMDLSSLLCIWLPLAGAAGENGGVVLCQPTQHTSEAGLKQDIFRATDNRQRLARKFCSQFDLERAEFCRHVMGGANRDDCQRQASQLLSRLLFVWFLQQRGFLAGDTRWLQNAWQSLGSSRDGTSFHRDVVQPLLYDVLSQRSRKKLSASLRPIPSVAEGLFKREHGESIEVADRAFERLFAFFELWDWRLEDESPDVSREHRPNVLGPDLLGYVFERHLDQKSTGAYYTGDDVSGYIGKSTIIPQLLLAARRACPSEFKPGSALWRLLRDQPDRYIHEPVRRGVIDSHGQEIPVPRSIARGLESVGHRKSWNQPAAAEYALPHETWREYAARRRRCLELRAELIAGTIHEPSDLVTHNLDLRRFAADAIASCHNPALLWAFWQTLRTMTVLDPTCGVGAFLLAALDVLQPLYTACLERMRDLVDRSKSLRRRADFQTILNQEAEHGGQSEYVVRSTIANNLYGVDLMPAAVEICRLRLIARLLAAADPCRPSKPLAAGALNIRAGNALVGFDWPSEFSEVQRRGGFDVVVGNPPYLEQREVDYRPEGYRCQNTGAIHALCVERGADLLHPSGAISMVVPLGLVSTQRMAIVQQILETNRDVWYAHFSWRPARLFEAVNRALTVFVALPGDEGHTWTTAYQRWTTTRAGLFERIAYVDSGRDRTDFWTPKLGDRLEHSILAKCRAVSTVAGDLIGAGQHPIYYRTTGGLYWKVFTDFPPAFLLDGSPGHSSRETSLSVARAEHVQSLVAALSSDLFWWWYTISSNLRDLNPIDIQRFPLPAAALDDRRLQRLGREYLDDLVRHSSSHVRRQPQTGRTETQLFKIQKSKPIIDRIDRALAPHYGLTAEELDFLTNYDIRYRLGAMP